MRFVKQKADRGAKCIRPHEEILTLPGVKGVRIFALGPPHRADLLYDEDPQGNEAFPGFGLSATAKGSFFAAAQADDKRGIQPFGMRYGIASKTAFQHEEYGSFFRGHYGAGDVPNASSTPPAATGETSMSPDAPVKELGTNQESTDESAGRSSSPTVSAAAPAPQPSAGAGDSPQTPSREIAPDEVVGDASFRRIDADWLYSAEDLALMLNKGINNTSLVLAFELERSGRVLLFVGDAQRGNWISWTEGSWTDQKGKEISVRDLLARTVLYKVGHHGSHNATLNGSAEDEYPNLAWMAQGRYADEFTAMIPAVHDWAYSRVPEWAHPLKSIKHALVAKAAGRVFQTDTAKLERPDTVSEREWSRFERRTKATKLYFEYEIPN
jgi:hypothetical protein